MSALPKLQQAPPRRPAARPTQAPARTPAPRPDLRVVPPPQRTRGFVAILSIMAALGVFGIVTLNALAAEAAFDAQRLERDVAALQVRYDELTSEVTALESPDRVQGIAVAELGLVPASEPGYLIVDQAPPAVDVAL